MTLRAREAPWALVLFAALLAGGAHAQASAPAVILLPLTADGTVSLKQAEGTTAQVRRAITPEVARLLSSSTTDVKQAGDCLRDVSCLARVAELRGADLLGAGTVSPAPDGLRVSLLVVTPGAMLGKKDALRRVAITLQGNDADERRLERLVRLAFNPSALRGFIAVSGEDGALVEIDGTSHGALPLPPIAGVLEGEHVLTVHKQGAGTFRRAIGVLHGEATAVKAVLVESTEAAGAPAVASDDGLPADVIVVGSIGAGLFVLGGVAGALSLRDALEIEARAATQNLAFPADAERYARGGLLALTANGLYLAGAVAVGAAAVLLVLE